MSRLPASAPATAGPDVPGIDTSVPATPRLYDFRRLRLSQRASAAGSGYAKEAGGRAKHGAFPGHRVPASFDPMVHAIAKPLDLADLSTD